MITALQIWTTPTCILIFFTLGVLSMTYHSTLVNRPWIDGNALTLVTNTNVTHVDLNAYIDSLGLPWFVILHTQGGMRLLARTILDGALEIRDTLPSDTRPLVWERATHDYFRQRHGKLLELAKSYPGKLDILCHYVPRPDFEPWPRGMVNHWRYDRKK